MTTITDFPNGYEEPYTEACRTCRGPTVLRRNGPHLELYCHTCGHIRWMQQNGSYKNFIMPFGKYEGKTIEWIMQNDTGYVSWAANEMTSAAGNIKRKFEKALADLCEKYDGEPEASRAMHNSA